MSSMMTPTTAAVAADLMKKLQAIVGSSHNVLDGRVENSTATAAYLKGQRLGHGSAVAIVCPTTLSQLPPIVQACLEAQCTIIVQGANTGLTGSSVPNNTTTCNSRPTVVISMKHLTTIVPVDAGMKMLCHAGVGLGSLQQYVEDTVPGRMSHSVLGSTFLNPTTAAGVAFGSGGTQIRKGPSTTERALYLKVADNGHGQPIVKIVNTLGIQCQELENNNFGPEGEFEYQGTKQFGDGGTVIDKLDAMARGNSTTHIKSNNTYGTHPTHDHEYSKSLCTFDEEVTRYNADTKGLDCNRSEGKVLMLATVHDTFPKPTSSKSYWFSFADFEMAIQFKEQVALVEPEQLPESIEYLDRGAFEVVDRAGRFMGHFIKYFGTTSPLVRHGWDLKVQMEALPGLATVPDTIQFMINQFLPPVIPKSVMGLSKKYEHHILLTVGNHAEDGDRGGKALQSFEDRLLKFRQEHDQNNTKMASEELTTQSMKDGVNAFRYIAAGAFETYCVGTNLQGISVDYGLPKNRSAAPVLDLAGDQPKIRMRYSHFGCNVVHEDLAYAPGVDTHRAKMALKKTVDEVCGGRLPAEHGHGIEYVAPLATKLRWMKMDPFNVMNPGVGGLSTQYKYGRDGESLWKEEEPHTGTRGTRKDRT